MLAEINIKIVVIGAASVGKSSIINSYLNKSFPKLYVPTLGNNISKKEQMIKDIALKISIWELGGQRKFNPLNPHAFNNVDGALFVFDLSQSHETLLELEHIYLKPLFEQSEKCVALALGNKLDLISDKSSLKKLKAQYSLNNIPLMFASAKNYEYISEPFDFLIYSCLQEREKKTPTEQLKGIALEYLRQCGKSEKQLNGRIVDLDKIELLNLDEKQKVPQIITKKVGKDSESIHNQEENLEQIAKLAQKLKNLNFAKSEIVNLFEKNLTTIKDVILNLKNTPINSLLKNIDSAISQLNQLKTDFEINLETLLKAGKSEEKK